MKLKLILLLAFLFLLSSFVLALDMGQETSLLPGEDVNLGVFPISEETGMTEEFLITEVKEVDGLPTYYKFDIYSLDDEGKEFIVKTLEGWVNPYQTAEIRTTISAEEIGAVKGESRGFYFDFLKHFFWGVVVWKADTEENTIIFPDGRGVKLIKRSDGRVFEPEQIKEVKQIVDFDAYVVETIEGELVLVDGNNLEKGYTVGDFGFIIDKAEEAFVRGPFNTLTMPFSWGRSYGDAGAVHRGIVFGDVLDNIDFSQAEPGLVSVATGLSETIFNPLGTDVVGVDFAISTASAVKRAAEKLKICKCDILRVGEFSCTIGEGGVTWDDDYTKSPWSGEAGEGLEDIFNPGWGYYGGTESAEIAHDLGSVDGGSLLQVHGGFMGFMSRSGRCEWSKTVNNGACVSVEDCVKQCAALVKDSDLGKTAVEKCLTDKSAFCVSKDKGGSFDTKVNDLVVTNQKCVGAAEVGR